jgi:hypothetical protein
MSYLVWSALILVRAHFVISVEALHPRGTSLHKPHQTQAEVDPQLPTYPNFIEVAKTEINTYINHFK